MRKENIQQNVIIKQLRDYVEKKRNYRNASLTGSDIATALGISRTTLTKCVSESMGTTLAKYLDKCRVQHARHHIIASKGKADIERVALFAGFRTIRTLNRKYKETYGELPSATMEK